MSAIKIYSNDSLLIVMWDHRPPGRFAPHDKICDILRAAIKSRISADMLSLRIWYSVIIHITYSLLHTCNFFQMLMQINRSNWGHLQKGALCPMLLYCAAPYQGGHLCTGGKGQVAERGPGGHQRLRVPSQVLPFPEHLSETCRRGSLISTHACSPDNIPIKFVCDSVWNFVECLAKIHNDQIYLGVVAGDVLEEWKELSFTGIIFQETMLEEVENVV